MRDRNEEALRDLAPRWLAAESTGVSDDSRRLDERLAFDVISTGGLPAAPPAARSLRSPKTPSGTATFISKAAAVMRQLSELSAHPGQVSVLLEEIGRSLPPAVAVTILGGHAAGPHPMVREGTIFGLEQVLERTHDPAVRAKAMGILGKLRDDPVAAVRDAAEDAFFYFDP